MVWRGEIDYALPPELIAQRPAEKRDRSRLMVVDRAAAAIHDATFHQLPDWLRRGDTLVANDSRVVAARLAATKPSGGRVELLLLDQGPGPVRAMYSSSKPLRSGQRLQLEQGYSATVAEPLGGGRCRLDFGEADIAEVVAALGTVPLPPYISRSHGTLREDLERYQTIYAREDGSVAAPTAGLHFTSELIAALRAAGVGFETVTLHVGPGTFVPIRGDAAAHRMEAERCRIDGGTAERLNEARRGDGRIVAVGTTSVRTLESAADARGCLRAFDGETELFIRSGHEFRAVDALVTNFHLPGSTLLCLVMAFAGVDLVKRAYALAVDQRYRFYSYGDAMLIV